MTQRHEHGPIGCEERASPRGFLFSIMGCKSYDLSQAVSRSDSIGERRRGVWRIRKIRIDLIDDLMIDPISGRL